MCRSGDNLPRWTILDERELGCSCRKRHSSRGTPLSPKTGRAVSLPQASAAKVPAHRITAFGRRVNLVPRAERFLT